MDLLHCELEGVRKIASGKVREMFDLGEHLLVVSTDRISAFDCILPNPIPNKGKVLNLLSSFWFNKLEFVPNHFVTNEFNLFPDKIKSYREMLSGRSMVVRKAVPLPVECVARGYLAGSGWKEYSEHGTVCGQELPPGLRQGDRLPATIFTPATKAAVGGHDENITWGECRRLLGEETAHQVREWTLELYEHGRAYAATRGILIADTKFEFGMIDDEVVLIDECLTPDSSRFWPQEEYQPGGSPPSFDKQYVRDYLETLDWDKSPPAPELPPQVVEGTAARYIEAYCKLTGAESLPDS